MISRAENNSLLLCHLQIPIEYISIHTTGFHLTSPDRITLPAFSPTISLDVLYCFLPVFQRRCCFPLASITLGFDRAFCLSAGFSQEFNPTILVLSLVNALIYMTPSNWYERTVSFQAAGKAQRRLDRI